MSPHAVNSRMLEANLSDIPDPGVGGVLRSAKAVGSFEFKAGASGTRIVAAPSFAGQTLSVSCVGAPTGTCSLTFAGTAVSPTGLMVNGTTSYNSAGTPATLNAITFNATDESCYLTAIRVSGGLKWLLVLTCGGAAA